MSKDGHANTATKHGFWESLARHTKSEMKCLGQKISFPAAPVWLQFPLLLTSASRQEAMLMAEPVLRAELQISGYWKLSRGNERPKFSALPKEAGAEQRLKETICSHKMSTRGGREEAPTPALIKTLEKPLCCCPFHRGPDLSPTFCRRQTALKTRPL